MRYIILGKILGILFVLMVFGSEFIAKKVPKINIDIATVKLITLFDFLSWVLVTSNIFTIMVWHISPIHHAVMVARIVY